MEKMRKTETSEGVTLRSGRAPIRKLGEGGFALYDEGAQKPKERSTRTRFHSKSTNHTGLGHEGKERRKSNGGWVNPTSEKLLKSASPRPAS